MPRTLFSVSLVAILASLAPGQTRPVFQAADVHASVVKVTNTAMRGGYLSGSSYIIHRATMVDLIRTAYAVDAEQVVGGPSWLEWDRYDVNAKAPANTTPENARLMLQNLLADRFKLAVHRDTRPLPVFVLSQGKSKPKMKAADGKGKRGCEVDPPSPPSPDEIPLNVAHCRSISMAAFAPLLRFLGNAYLTSPVLDSTGLSGEWDFDLKWTSRGLLGLAGADGISISDAVDRQLGLKLEEGKAPAPVIVVDSVNEKPAPNPSNTAALLPPPPPAEFEVADIRPSPPDATPAPGGLRPGGRYEQHNVPLFLLIDLAYNVGPAEVDRGMVLGAPKWLTGFSPSFDLVAKVAVVTGGNQYNQQIDDDDLAAMLRSLLADRFKMKVHTEDRPMDAYTLVADKPKLKAADPSNRTGCKMDRPLPPGPDGPPPARVTCLNITMEQFAEQLRMIAPVYLNYPVENASGLTGAYDFTLTFSRIPPGRGGGGGGRGGGKGAPAPARIGDGASDPSGGVSLFDAVQKQLGLKLESHKRSEPVFVIDHIEEKPTDN